MIHVTDLVSRLWPAHEAGWLREMGYEGKRTEEDILKWSSEFGTAMHAWCIEGVVPDKPSTMMKQCKRQYDRFSVQECPKVIFAEKSIVGKDEFGDAIYVGTSDLGSRIKGDFGVVELKFFSCWKWWLNFNVPTKEKIREIKETNYIDGVKAAKANLQTKLYAETEKEKVDFRAVLWITPKFFIFKKFKREPKKFDQAIELAKSEKKSNLNF